MTSWDNNNHNTSEEANELVPRVITCIDCGGRAHLLTIVTDEQPLYPGDITTYRCEDCRDRWDLVVPGGDDDPEW